MELNTYLDHSSRFAVFKSPLTGRPGIPSDVLSAFRTQSALLSTEFVAASAKEFAAHVDWMLNGVGGERAVLDAFGYLAVDLRRAVTDLEVISVMSSDLKERLMSVYTELVEAARKAVDRTALSLSDIKARHDHSERMREFIEMAKPKVLGYREFFEHAKAGLEENSKPINSIHNGA